MFGRLSVLYAPAYRRTFYLARHFCAEAELLVEDGNKSKSYKSLRPIYFDFQASTQVDPRVLDAMLPFYINYFGNPHSRTHEYGWYCGEAIEKARMNVARLINADHKEVIFTSGATESNNLAVKGVAKFYYPKKKHIVTTQIEHKCVLDSCRVLENSGFEVTYLPVKKSGVLDLEVLEKSIRPETTLVSVLAVNNEIGVRQPIEEIGKLCRSKGVFFHTDAAQAFGKVPLDVNAMNIDLMSISGHKIYGPQGIGALYIRRRPRVRLEAQQSGGGQERGLRSGTLPTALVVGLGEASRVASEEMKDDYEHVSALSKRLIDGITSKIQHVTLNGDPVQRYPGCVNFSFAYVEGESLLMVLKNIALSSGSACTSASLEPSYVLRAIGTEEDLAHSSIRFGIGRFTTEEEVDFTITEITKHVQRLREMSPLWEMVSEGIDIKSIQWTQH
uniref:cysteine desulfurase n=1 Tax=Schistosoma japonicum TaxID=6182 RepID=C1LED9_SCHJA|nr:NFS1 nitrogen fixation 1 [Schistosoma japonicum]